MISTCLPTPDSSVSAHTIASRRFGRLRSHVSRCRHLRRLLFELGKRAGVIDFTARIEVGDGLVHDEPPLGLIVDVKEHKRGLWIKAELPRDDTFVSGRIIPQLKRRGLKGMSIGYKAIEKEQRGSLRYLKQIRLIEVSVVNAPMNPLAEIETVKGLDLDPTSSLGRELAEATREMQRLTRRIRQA